MHHSKSRETSEYQELGVFQKYIEKQFLERKGTFLNNKTVGFLSNMIYIEYCFISFACHFVTELLSYDDNMMLLSYDDNIVDIFSDYCYLHYHF